MRKTLKFAVVGSATVALFTAVALLGAPVQAEEYSTPNAPTEVSSTATPTGLRVMWKASGPTSPAITHYVVSAGPASCPVTVPASATSAVLPYIKGSTTVTPIVQAVNAYGFSVDGSGAAVRVPAKSTPGFRNIQFLEFSDFHGAIQSSSKEIGAAVLAAAFAADRKAVKSTFVVSAGDNIGGAPVISSEFEEIPTIEALNLMGVDVSNFGNHEFDRPLAHLRKMIDLSTFSWVGTDFNNMGLLKGKKKSAKDVVMKASGNVRVGFVGLDTADLAVRVTPTNLVDGKKSLVIDDSKVKPEIAKLRAQGAQLVVALIHRGWNTNASGSALGPLLTSIPTVKGADLAFGGDSHLQYASIISGIPVVQVTNSGVMYSRTIMCLDTVKNRPVGSSVSFVTKEMLAQTPGNPSVTKLVESYKQKLGAKLDVKVGSVSGVFPQGGTPPIERSGQTAIGDYAADVIREKYATDFVFFNGGGIRDSLPASTYSPLDSSLRRPSSGSAGPYDVTLGDVTTVFPFGNNIATTSITGNELWQALENGVSKYPSDGRFPQISGFKFTFDPSKLAGSRVTSVSKPDGTPIAQNGTSYSIATLDFMVSGGDGYGTLFHPATALMREPYVDAIVHALKADLAANKITQVPVNDGRIRRD